MYSLAAWQLLGLAALGGIDMSGAQKTIEGIPIYNYDGKKISKDGKTTWIVVNKETASEYQVHSLCVEAQGCIAEGSPTTLGGLGFSTVEATEKDLAKLVRNHKNDIEFIEADMTVKALGFFEKTPLDDESPVGVDLLEGNSSMQGSTNVWGLDRIDDAKGLDGDYSPPGDGRGVHVYVLDTGIRTSHSDFGGRAIPAIDSTSGRVKVCSPSDRSCAMDRQSHGTHCAGTIGGNKYGVAKGVTLHAAKVLGDSGSGSWAGIMGAMDWVSTKGKKPAIMSMSLGGGGRSQSAVTAVDRAAKNGVTVVVAAGNENSDACGFTPAFVPQAVTVGATDRNDARARFSNYGRCLDIWGPGVQITSALSKSDSASGAMSGTSMACPHVAGGAALLLAKNPSMSVNALISGLKRNAVKGAVSDPKTGSPNDLLNVGSGGGGSPNPSPSPSPSPGCPPCRCPSPSPGGGGPSPSPGGENRRRRNRGGKGGEGDAPAPSEEARRRRRKKEKGEGDAPAPSEEARRRRRKR